MNHVRKAAQPGVAVDRSRLTGFADSEGLADGSGN
jgi:hypothetical protein